jgi:tRNA nucleotidyltransferase (CCA-adding enzyme)
MGRMERLLDFQAADFGGDDPDTAAGEELRRLLRALAEKEGSLTLKTLAVKGADLMKMGMQPGPQLGRTLNALLEKVLAGELPNEKDALLDAALKG